MMNAAQAEEVTEQETTEEVVVEETETDEAITMDPRKISLMRKRLAKATEQSIAKQKRRKANKLARRQRRVNHLNNHRKGQK